MIVGYIDILGLSLINFYKEIRAFLKLFKNTILALRETPFRTNELKKSLYFIGNQSLVIILFSVCFAAMVTILESSFHMKLVIQNDSMVPGFSAMLIIRELGAVVTALLLTSRVGAGIAAELGLMKVTDQVDALKMLAIDPVQFLVAPRWIASIVMTVILTVVANLVCLFVAFLVSTTYLDIAPGMYLASLRQLVHFQDLWFSVIKAAFFGAMIPIISAYYGLKCESGAEGVGSATTSSVVASSVVIIVIDFILTYIFSYFY